MNILQLTTNFLPGGIQRHVLDLTADLRSRGHQVTLAGDSGDWAEPGTVLLPLNRVTWRGGNAAKRLAALWPCVRQLRATVRKRGVQLIHAHETAPTIVARLATLGLRVPVLFTFHGSAPAREAGVARVSRACATITVSPSRDGVERLVGHGVPCSRCRVLGLGIPPLAQVPEADVAALRAQLLGGRDGPLIMSLSRLDPQKGIDVMIAVARRVVERFPGVVFAVGGKGPLADRVEGWARDAGVAQAVRFMGMVSTVPAHLRAADLFLLTSRWENRPISIVEAFGAGLPVVATDCGGVRELVDDRVGALVPVNDPEEIAAALIALLSDPERMRQSGQAALARSRSAAFDPHSVHAQFEALYREVLGRK
ncbi:MAG: glycosyltransferase family 4 protein [Novosphingobium sp.]